MTDKDIELITGFLENELTEQEIEEFKARYGSDEEFTREVNERSQIYISLEAASRLSLKNMVEKPLLRRIPVDRVSLEKVEIGQPFRWVFRVAAVLIPLVGLGIGIRLWVRPGATADELYLTYLHKSRSNDEWRAFAGDRKENFSLMQKDIDNVILENLDKLGSPRELHDFGLFCMEGRQFNEAIFAFGRVIGMKDPEFLESSEWNLGLCYLKTGDIAKAREFFSLISGKPGHKFGKESKELLRKIK